MTSETPSPARSAIVLRLVAVGVLLLLDLWSKSAVFAHLKELKGIGDLVRCPCGLASHDRWHLLGDGVGWFTFMEAENSGAAFGMGASWPTVLVVGRILAVVLLLVLLIRSPKGRGILTTAFVLILAGALGNLYDNLGRANWAEWWGGEGIAFEFGPVRDFIDVYFSTWTWHFPTFNVADSCITVGAVLLLSSGLFGQGAETPEESSAETSARS